jgi:hypothetical protein
MLIGALLFAAAFTASGFLFYRKARSRYGSRPAADMLGNSHLRILGVLIVAYLLARSGIAATQDVVEAILLFGLAGTQAVSNIVRMRARRRAGEPLLVPDGSRIGGRIFGAMLTFGAFAIGIHMIETGAASLIGVAGFSACALSAVTVLQASRGLAVVFEGGVIRRYGFLPWSRVQAYRWIEYQDNAELQLVLSRPWWLRNEITVVVPRANLPTLQAWLGRRLPCLGTQRQLTKNAYRPA